MSAIYPHKWTSALGDDPRGMAGREWSTALAGFTRVQIDVGLAACVASADPWPPSLPAFKGQCMGIPSLAAVKLDVNRADSIRQPFTVLTLQHLDRYRFRQVPVEQAERMLREAYELAREHVMRGGALPEPRISITADKVEPRPASPEVVAAALAKGREILGMMDADEVPVPVDVAPRVELTEEWIKRERAGAAAYYASIPPDARGIAAPWADLTASEQDEWVNKAAAE